MSDFVVALGLVLVIEGLLFLALPGMARQAMAQMMEAPPGALRITGLVSALIGLAVIWLIRG